MTAPIPLFGRDQVPQPDGEPEITMFMDDDRIIFRDQQALDAYTQADTVAALERAAQEIEAAMSSDDVEYVENATSASQEGEWSWFRWHAASIIRAQKEQP